MKVTDASQINALAPSKSPEPSRTPDPTGKGDTVTTDASAQVSEAVAQALASVPVNHSAKLQEIEAQVQLGTYRPDPQAIAEQILDDAELAARLQSLFTR
ncbi:MAG TPA: flagellar biosynthesis anti-sigma factor FlgM [Anaeromyxobacteraceae bacterium]|nr:flagellar biosynthesis anti-sigma factor FlgM [Anaeromyxobacteraceae bacterium]